MPPAGRARLDDGAECLEPCTPTVEATGESAMAWLLSDLAVGGRATSTSRSVSGWSRGGAVYGRLGKPWATAAEAGVALAEGP